MNINQIAQLFQSAVAHELFSDSVENSYADYLLSVSKRCRA